MEKLDKLGRGNAQPMAKIERPVLANEINKIIDRTNEIINHINSKTQLAIAQQEATLVTEEDYTVDSWGVLVTALALPEITQPETSVKTLAINTAIDNLVFIGLEDLEQAKLDASALVEGSYTPETWGDLEDALALPETTNALIVIKTNAINDAVTNLALKYLV